MCEVNSTLPLIWMKVPLLLWSKVILWILPITFWSLDRTITLPGLITERDLEKYLLKSSMVSFNGTKMKLLIKCDDVGSWRIADSPDSFEVITT